MNDRPSALSEVAHKVLHVLLELLPALPVPVLKLVTARTIELIDELDGDPDLEDDAEDRGEDEQNAA